MPLKIFSEAEHLISGFPGLVLGPKGITRQSSGCGYFISSLADESLGPCFWSFFSLAQGPHASSINLGTVTTSGTRPHIPVLLQVDGTYKHLGTLLNSRESVGAWVCVFLTSSQVLILLVWGPHSENRCHGHLWETLGTTWLHNGLCFYVAGSRCHLGTTVFPFQGITCFLFSVFNPDSLLSPQLWSSYRISTARAPWQTTEQLWGLSHPTQSLLVQVWCL